MVPTSVFAVKPISYKSYSSTRGTWVIHTSDDDRNLDKFFSWKCKKQRGPREVSVNHLPRAAADAGSVDINGQCSDAFELLCRRCIGKSRAAGVCNERVESRLEIRGIRVCQRKGTSALQDASSEQTIITSSICCQMRVYRDCAGADDQMTLVHGELIERGSVNVMQRICYSRLPEQCH